jgi:hypothetical protein
MSYLSENIIPGKHGKTFTVNFHNQYEFEEVRPYILAITGVKDVLFNQEVSPHEIVVHTYDVVDQHEVQEAIRKAGYHAVPKRLFALGNTH